MEGGNPSPSLPFSPASAPDYLLSSSSSHQVSFNLVDFPRLQKNGDSFTEKRGPEMVTGSVNQQQVGLNTSDDSENNNGFNFNSSNSTSSGVNLGISGANSGVMVNPRSGTDGDLGLKSNPNVSDKEWRKLFPKSRAATPVTPMKFTPPVDMNGKILVAAQTDNFQDGLRKCENMVVGFFVEKRPSFAAVQLGAGNLWKFKKEVSIKLYDDCAFIFEFKDEEDRRLVLDTGSCYIANKLFILRPWAHLLEKSVSQVKSVPIWVLIYGVPLHMWNNDGLGLIASYLGIPLFADDCTLNQNRLAFARVCIEIGLDFAYPSSIPLLLDGKIALELPVEYQWKPPKCDGCMAFGHTAKSCAKKKKNKWIPKKIGKPSQFKDIGDVEKNSADTRLFQVAIDKNMGSDNIVTVVNSVGDHIPMGIEDNNASNRKGVGAVNDSNNASTSGVGALQKEDSIAEKNTCCGPKKLGFTEKAKDSSAQNSTTGVEKSRDKSTNGGGVVTPTRAATSSGSCAIVVGMPSSEIGAQENWTEAKGKKNCAKKPPSPKKNPFIMYSDFPYQSSSRFPIDRRKELDGVITPSKNRFQIEEIEEGSEELEEKEFDRNMEYVSLEDQYSKKKERELHRLQWDGNPKIAKEDNKILGRGCRSQAKKRG